VPSLLLGFADEVIEQTCHWLRCGSLLLAPCVRRAAQQ
jgi:hypothetical protein